MKGALRDVALRTPARRWLLVEPKFVIVGTGRSGTGYISRLLRQVGVRCGHEQWWTLRKTQRQAIRLVGDASWPATFQLDGYKGQVFHQVRDPIRVMNSHFSDLTSGHRRGDQIRLHRSQWVDLSSDPAVDVLRIYVRWATKAEEVSEWTWRLEDIDAVLLQQICERIGRPIIQAKAEAGIASVPTDTNRHADSQRIGWDDLPDIPLKAEAKDIARQYGYL